MNRYLVVPKGCSIERPRCDCATVPIEIDEVFEKQNTFSISLNSLSLSTQFHAHERWESMVFASCLYWISSCLIRCCESWNKLSQKLPFVKKLLKSSLSRCKLSFRSFSLENARENACCCLSRDKLEWKSFSKDQNNSIFCRHCCQPSIQFSSGSNHKTSKQRVRKRRQFSIKIVDIFLLFLIKINLVSTFQNKCLRWRYFRLDNISLCENILPRRVYDMNLIRSLEFMFTLKCLHEKIISWKANRIKAMQASLQARRL